MAGYFRLFKLTTIHIYSLHVVFLTRSVAARVSSDDRAMVLIG
ncbi:hypothetical protein HanIR_Chr11g0558781 [Helianthus annuus]|nr:hypothetical protein HanIR_Chr11g0558781 [Helianthus annuus]